MSIREWFKDLLFSFGGKQYPTLNIQPARLAQELHLQLTTVASNRSMAVRNARLRLGDDEKVYNDGIKDVETFFYRWLRLNRHNLIAHDPRFKNSKIRVWCDQYGSIQFKLPPEIQQYVWSR